MICKGIDMKRFYNKADYVQNNDIQINLELKFELKFELKIMYTKFKLTNNTFIQLVSPTIIAERQTG